tara:strand:- start:311 stop:625 length:315 start_codon:yes stop_codon:yes gene_type:complete
MKYDYSIESYFNNKWMTILKNCPQQYCFGYVDSYIYYAPRCALRIKRSDGKIIREIAANDDVNIGQIAGWPTAEQYESAGNRALETAKVIRERNNANNAKRNKL